MKHLITSVLFIAFGMLSAQSNFKKGMEKAFELLQSDKPDEAINLFERILLRMLG